MRNERRLKVEHKLFIMTQLGVGEGLTKTAELFKAQFGLDIDRRHVAKYDPARNPKMEKPMVKLFYVIRERHLKLLAEIPLAHKSFRLRELQKMLDRAEDSPVQNAVEMRAILDHAAKESNDFWCKK